MRILLIISLMWFNTVLHKPIFKCFIHTLRDVNPALAADLEAKPLLLAPVHVKGAPIKPKGAPGLRLPGNGAVVRMCNSRVSGNPAFQRV